MEEQLVSFKTAKLAKEKGFNEGSYHLYTYPNNELKSFQALNYNAEQDGLQYEAPTQSLLQKFIRETRGVHIEIHRNASGYYWSMCKADGGTDLGWSDISGPNDGGVWNSFEGALENALQVQLSYDLPNNITIIKHWGNYVEFALKSK